MDSFYASCEELRHPELRGKPFIVGTGGEEHKLKGVVETANYFAKKSGIRSAMPTVTALKLNKDVVYVPSDHDYYDSMSMKVMELLKTNGFRMEVLSVDEAALDLGECSYIEAEKTAKKIKQEINEKLGLQCTIGVCNGKILAKMVCDSAKPDGLKVLKSEQLQGFLENKNVDKIPGVGAKTAEKLAAIGIKTIGDMKNVNQQLLIQTIGSFGAELYQLAHGIDNSKIVDVWKVLSIGRERTLDKKTDDLEEVNKMLDKLADEVIDDLMAKGLSYKTVTVKARYSDFTDKIKGKSFTNYTDSAELLKSTAHLLMKELVGEKLFRKVGVKVSSFSEKKLQKKLF